LTAACLFSARDHRLPVGSLLTLACVTVVFESFSNFVCVSIFFALRVSKWRGSACRGITLNLSTNHASAFGAWVVDNIEFLTNIVGQALILTTTGILAAFHLSIGFALTSVALLLDFSSNGNGLTILLTITWNRIVGALKLTILHTSASIAFISVKLSSNVDDLSIRSSTSTWLIGAFNLSGCLAGAGVAGILGRSSLGELLSKVVGHAISGTATGSVGAGNLTILLAGASVAVIWSCLSDSQSGTLVLAVAWDRIVLAFNLSVLHASTSVASISFVEC